MRDVARLSELIAGSISRVAHHRGRAPLELCCSAQECGTDDTIDEKE